MLGGLPLVMYTASILPQWHNHKEVPVPELNRPPDRPMYQQIAGYYESLIASGQIAPGDRLPTVEEICATWQVAPGTAHKAIRLLQQRHLVTSHVGRGTYAA